MDGPFRMLVFIERRAKDSRLIQGQRPGHVGVPAGRSGGIHRRSTHMDKIPPVPRPHHRADHAAEEGISQAT